MTETSMQAARRESVSISDAIDVLVRQAPLIAKFTSGGLAIAILYLLVTQPMYRADTQIVLDQKAPMVMRETSADAANNLDSSQLETQIVVLRSRAISEAVIHKLKLQEDPDFQGASANNGTFGWLKRLWPGSPVEVKAPGRPIEPALAQFRDNLRVSRVGISYAIEVSFFSKSAEKAALIANATTDAYLQSLIDVRTEAGRAASEWLEERISDLRVQMNAAARRAQQFRASQDYRIVNKNREAEAGPGAKVDPVLGTKEPVTLEELELTADTYRKAYQHFYSAFAQAVQRESYPVSNVRVISRASIPTQKSSPKTLLALAIGAAIGGLIGIGLAMVLQAFPGLDRFARSFRGSTASSIR